MSFRSAGIHHVTAIAGDPQRNLAFYAGILGLRLVKVTVNYDDPATYHFYYGDETGSPGSVMTFFPWRDAPRGRSGVGQISVTSFAIPPEAIAFWVGRLIHHGISYQGPLRRWDETVLTFSDPDGLVLELVGHPSAEERLGWVSGPIPPEAAIRGIYGVTVLEHALDPTGPVLVDTLGFAQTHADESRFRFEAPGDGLGRIIDVHVAGGFWGGIMGVGTIHHVAYRATDDTDQHMAQAQIKAAGMSTTAVLDRHYFRSVYFREPGEVLFEIATEGPGFMVDETRNNLGTGLRLPPWLEASRSSIQTRLPSVELPASHDTVP
ncbi:MAG: ring-cleaving dioxygenase [Gemmatimonadota bacterium]